MLVHTIRGIAICLIGSDFPATCTNVMKACCIHALSSKICSNSFQWRQTKLADGDVYLPKKPCTKKRISQNTTPQPATLWPWASPPIPNSSVSNWQSLLCALPGKHISSGASNFGLRFDKRQKVCQIYLISLFHSLLYNSNIHVSISCITLWNITSFWKFQNTIHAVCQAASIRSICSRSSFSLSCSRCSDAAKISLNLCPRQIGATWYTVHPGLLLGFEQVHWIWSKIFSLLL